MKRSILITVCTAIMLMLYANVNLYSQNNGAMEKIAATELYKAFSSNSGTEAEKYRMKTMIITGTAVKVGPDVYGLPSVEVAEVAGEKCKVLCVLPFSDYLKLRHVSKKDKVEMQGEVRGYNGEYDLVVVKQSKIISVNGKKL